MSGRHFRFAAAAVSALAVAALFVGAPSAFADVDDPYSVGGVNQEASVSSLINPDATTQLSIHKYLGMDSGVAGDGTQQVITGHDALQGVRFDVYLVGGVDLTTNAGWAAATALSGYAITAADVAAGSITVGGTTYPLTLAESVTTNATGTATFTKTDGVGLYLVAENVAASGTITNLTTNTEVPNSSVTGAAPFMVTLPMTNPADTTRWMYDVNVYPKNQADTATKAVEDRGTVTSDAGNVGDQGVDFTIVSSITDGTVPLGAYGVYDDLDASLTLTGVAVALSDGTTLVAGTDYEVYTDPAAFRTPGSTAGTLYTSGGEVASGPVVSVVFTTDGLTKLEADRSLSVVTTISVRLGTETDNGLVPNTATFIPNQSWFDQHPTTPGEEPGTPTNTTESKYGNVVVNKQDPADTTADMTGAEFTIFSDQTPGDGTCSTSDVSGTAIATGTIIADNTVTFTGLQASNWYNGAAVLSPTDWLSYCLVETKAPTGYNLDATAHYITIDYTTATATTPAIASVTVNNEKANLGNSLPLTGGEGVATLSIIGLVLVGGGIAYYLATTRKHRRDQATTANQ